MTNTFKIVITASDKATATVRKVNDAIARVTRPLTQVKTSVGALGRELGIDKMTAGLGKMGKAAAGVAMKAAKVVGAIAAVAGVGSLAALASMTREWAFAGAAVLRFIAITGAAANSVQSLTGAAELLGLQGADLQSGLKAIGDTMENAFYGRDQAAMAMMNRLGISMHKTANGSVDVVRGLYDIANAVQRTKNVQAQAVIARTFGVEALLPMLQKGAAGIRAYQEEVRKSGAVQSNQALKAAADFQYSLALTTLNITGVKNAIMNALVPSLKPLVDGFRQWTQENRAAIATNVKSFIEGVAGAAKMLGGILIPIVRYTINWKVAAYALTAILAGRLLMAIYGIIAPVVLLTARLTILTVTTLPLLMLRIAALAETAGLPLLARGFLGVGLALETMLGPLGLALAAVTALGFAFQFLSNREAAYRAAHHIGPDRAANRAGGRGTGLPSGSTGSSAPRGSAARAMAFFQQQGWSRAQAAGLVGNLSYESGGLNPADVGDTGSAYGIGQWHKSRQADFKRLFGRDIQGSSLDDQLRFAQWELQNTERAAGARIGQATTASGAASEAMFGYERPKSAASLSARVALAESLVGGSGAGSAAPTHRVDVAINMKGAPPGTTAKVKTPSSAPVKASVKIDHSMPEFSPP